LAAAKALLGPPVINVAPCQNLQTLLDSVQPGTILQLEPGASHGPTTIRRSVTIQPRGFVAGQTPDVRFVANGVFAVAIESGDVTLIGVELTGYANDIPLIKQSAAFRPTGEGSRSKIRSSPTSSVSARSRPALARGTRRDRSPFAAT
jgi:hypothetical protein